MAKELLEQARSAAEDLGFEDDFLRSLFSGVRDDRRVVTAQLQPILQQILTYLGTGAGLSSIGALVAMAPATLYTLARGTGVAAERAKDYLLRTTGIDKQAGLPWMIGPDGERIKDPSWDEPSGTKRIKEIPEYAMIPNSSLTPEYDEARNIEEDALRDAVKLPDDFGTSGLSSRDLRERYMRERHMDPSSMVHEGPAYDPLDEINAKRINRAAGSRRKFVKAQKLSSGEMGHLVNAPDHQFLSFALPPDLETAASVFAGTPIYTPITQSSPRYLPFGGQGYSPEGGAAKWMPGGTPYETAMNKLEALSDPGYSAPAMTAGIEAMYNSVLMKAKGGVIDPMTARAAIDQIPHVFIAAGVPEEVVWEMHQRALDRLESGAGGYRPSAALRYRDIPEPPEGFVEDSFASGRGDIIEGIEGRRSRLEDIANMTMRNRQNLDPMMRGMSLMGF